MRFLYIHVIECHPYMPMTLKQLGHTYEIFNYTFHPLKENIEASTSLYDFLSKKHDSFDFVISFLFIPEVSNISNEYSLPYISWSYDSPLMSLFHSSIYNKNNYTFLFDKSEYNYLKAKNIPNLYHQPLAAKTLAMSNLFISGQDENIFSHEISFVGNLYEDNNYNNVINSLPDSISLEIKSYLVKNLCNWSQTKKWPAVSDDILEYYFNNFSAKDWTYFSCPANLFFGFLILSRKLAEMDRLTVLNTLAENHSVHLYTSSKSKYLSNINVHPPANYNTDANKVFYLSKINLNITLPSICTGVPQRVFDIMTCGGFVMSNHQEEMEDLFTIGEDIETFKSLEELKEKTNFYLAHEKERVTIAMNGYQKVRDNYSYEIQLKKIIDIASKSTGIK